MAIPEELITILAAVGMSWARMTIALIISIVFSLCVGIPAAINKAAEKIIIPILDILQSIPILSFFPIALYVFIMIHPIIGPELAAIFLIFTSQAWNIAFGVYKGVRLIPPELREASSALGLSAWKRLTSLYIPAAFPGIAGNLPPSWANGLYFLMACEIITVGEAKWSLFGIGTLSTNYILAGRVAEFVMSMAAVVAAVILMNLLVFIPVMRLSERYKFEERAAEMPRVWIERVSSWLSRVVRRISFGLSPMIGSFELRIPSRIGKGLLIASLSAAITALLWQNIFGRILTGATLTWAQDILEGFLRLGVIDPLVMIGFSLARVSAAVAFGLLWTMPVAILIYENKVLEKILIPPFQIIASFPATLILPLIAKAIIDSGLPLELGAFLMILLGTQWYLLFFLLDGLRGIPYDEEEVCRALGMTRIQKLKHLYLPRMLPSLIMGCLVCFGGGWNTLVIAERAFLGEFTWDLGSPGIGRMLSIAVESGDIALLIAATIWMAGFIVLLNRLLWRRLYERAVRMVGVA
ncbi:MAG: ABC transporter permease subunit [Nitrososphaerota archaeon]